jgi:hypothetical protein
MNLETKRVDWKFATTFILSIIAIAAPLWLWKADLDSKNIDMTLLGRFELISAISESRRDIRILYDGKDVKDPFGSIISISNSGAKPIQASDFDGKIKITVAKPARILKSQIVRREPRSLEPLIFTNDTMITIDPMLLNPGDLILVEILTTGGRPEFSSRGRIAGVPDVKIEESRSKGSIVFEAFGKSIYVNAFLGWPLYLIVAFGSIYAYSAAFIAFSKGIYSTPVSFLGTANIALMSNITLSFIARFVFDISDNNMRMVFVYASLGVGLLLYQAAIRIFPGRR